MAVNLTALNTVYNHFLTSYAPKGSTPYDSHKKSELRGVYNSMLKLNKDSPLYLIKSDSDTSEFVIGVKENARDLKNRIASLGGLTEESLLGKKIATSTNDSIAEANYIGTEPNEQQISKLTLSVKQLATPQINTGTYLSNNFIKMPEENYSFDIGINNSKYEFQFNVYQEDTNKEVQERLSRLINNSNIGIKANILEDGNGNSSLVLESKATGMQFADKAIFTVSDDETSREKGIVAYLGLDQITTTPKNASFRLNGEERRASTNNFTIERQRSEKRGVGQ